MPAGVYGTWLGRRRLRGEAAAAAARDTERRAAERVAAQ
jgi:hypothetical protein